MREEISAGILIFKTTPQGRKYLLLHYPGITGKDYWEFPKGHLEEGESPSEAALREAREETGLKISRLIPGFTKEIQYYFRQGSALIRKKVIFYLAEVSEGNVRVSSEHLGYRWVNPVQAKKIIKFKNSRKLIDEAEKFLCSKSSENSVPDSSG
ncbi:NUDIX domain-containing protein [bacterium]|nr:NUDIX domain-containing protein [bacterium]